MARNYFVLWVDGDIDLGNKEFKKSLAQVQAVVSGVNICHTSTQCKQILNETDQDAVFVILSGALAQQLVPAIHQMPRVHTIYIYFDGQVQNTKWAKDWRKIQGVFTSIKLLCEALNKAVHMWDHNDILMSFIPKETTRAIITTSTNEQVADQLPPSYMYSVIFKEIVLEIDDDHNKQMKDLVEYCRKSHVPESQLIEFQNQYHHKSPVYWYTRDIFLYRQINHALRTLNMESMMKMGFFIRHLHLQLQQLHQEQLESFREKLTVYRGQALSKEDFQKLCATKYGLLSFNSFLSTSKEKTTVTIFAPNAIEPDIEKIGVIFVITIDPNEISTSTTPFAHVGHYSAIESEEEILFTMHTVFRVMDITESTDNVRLHEVQLSMTSDNDPQMVALTRRLKQEVQGPTGWYRIGRLMLQVGHFNQAEQLYNQLRKDAKSDEERLSLHHQLAITKCYQGEYQKATKLFEDCLEIQLKTVPEDDISLASTYSSIGVVYQNMGDYSKALEFHKKSLKINEQVVPQTHSNLPTSYNNIGQVYDNMGDYSKALECYENSLKINEQVLPPTHPHLATSYNNIGQVYHNMGDYSKALEFYEKSLKIRQEALPPTHPDLATSYSCIGGVYSSMGDYSKAFEFNDKSLKIKQQALPPAHAHLVSSHNNIASVYGNIGD